MYTKINFLSTIAHETEVCKHLHGKMNEAMLTQCAVKGARSNHDLLKYLTYCGSGPVEALIQNDWSVIAKFRDKVANLKLADFPARMNAQRDHIAQGIEKISDEELRSRTAILPWGGTTSLGAALVDTSLRFLAAYRLQLFNNIKACGHPELSTQNAWRGKDAPSK